MANQTDQDSVKNLGLRMQHRPVREHMRGKFQVVWKPRDGVHSAKIGSRTAISFVSLCGAYGSQKAVKLRQVCEPQDRTKRQAQWAAITIKTRHPVSKEALVQLQRAYVLRRPPAVPWATQGTDAEKPVAQHEEGTTKDDNHAAGDEWPAGDRQAEGHPAAAGQEGQQDDWSCMYWRANPGHFGPVSKTGEQHVGPCPRVDRGFAGL
jgi:hypothetical protein